MGCTEAVQCRGSPLRASCPGMCLSPLPMCTEFVDRVRAGELRPHRRTPGSHNFASRVRRAGVVRLCSTRRSNRRASPRPRVLGRAPWLTEQRQVVPPALLVALGQFGRHRSAVRERDAVPAPISTSCSSTRRARAQARLGDVRFVAPREHQTPRRVDLQHCRPLASPPLGKRCGARRRRGSKVEPGGMEPPGMNVIHDRKRSRSERNDHTVSIRALIVTPT